MFDDFLNSEKLRKKLADEETQFKNYLLSHGFYQSRKLSSTFIKDDKSGFAITLWIGSVFLELNDEPVASSNNAQDFPIRKIPKDILIKIATGPSKKILLTLRNMETDNILKTLD